MASFKGRSVIAIGIVAAVVGGPILHNLDRNGVKTDVNTNVQNATVIGKSGVDSAGVILDTGKAAVGKAVDVLPKGAINQLTATTTTVAGTSNNVTP
jgi:hypothetical protein